MTNVDANEVSRFSPNSYLEGNFYTETDIRIDGYLKGTISTAGKVVIGENAVVMGNILCEKLDVWGKIIGDIYVDDTLILRESSDVESEMNFTKFQVEVGAKYTGTCRRASKQEFESRLKAAAPSEDSWIKKEGNK